MSAPPATQTQTVVDTTLLKSHLATVFNSFLSNASEDLWKNATSLVIASGREKEGVRASRTLECITYFTGYEINDFVLILNKPQRKIQLVTSRKRKEGFFSPLAELTHLPLSPQANPNDNSPANKLNKVTFEIVQRGKNGTNAQLFANLLKNCGNTLGYCLKDSDCFEGKFWTEWTSALKAYHGTSVDVVRGFQRIIAVQETAALNRSQMASNLCARLLRLGWVSRMETIIDEELNVVHAVLGEEMEKIIENPAEKLKIKVKASSIECDPLPLIVSGNSTEGYDLSISGDLDEKTNLSYDIIVTRFCCKVKSYQACIGRTYLVDPPKSVETNYKFLVRLHANLLENLKAGRLLRDVHASAMAYVRKHRPDLEKNLAKTFGHATGVQYRNRKLLISGKNSETIEKNMVFILHVSLTNLNITKDEKAKRKKKNMQPIKDNYALLVSDTVKVEGRVELPTVLTKANRELGDISYTVAESDDEEQSESEEDADDEQEEEEDDEIKEVKAETTTTTSSEVDGAGVGGIAARAAARRSKRREDEKSALMTDANIEKHQAALMKRKQQEALYGATSDNTQRAEEENKEDMTVKANQDRVLQKFSTNKSPSEYPMGLSGFTVSVDEKNNCVFIPINGCPVPFDISMIKSVNKSEEEKATFLRFNFFAPGMGFGGMKNQPLQLKAALARFPLAAFIREITVRAVDSRNLNLQCRLIKDMMRLTKQKKSMELAKKDLVSQEKLVKLRGSIARMRDVSMRPRISGRKTVGTIEVHQNGILYKSSKGQQIEVIYKNVRQAIFQPCEKELVVLVHFHLKNPILIGKKQTSDVQFYTEVMEASQTLDSRSGSMYDPDELADEQRERMMKKKLNKLFKRFCMDIERVVKDPQSGASWTFDAPYRDLGFQGVPNKEMVLLQPTVNALVNLTEYPFFTVMLEDIEHVHFERVLFNSKNFDMSIIFKDLKKPVKRISMIPLQQLENIKKWLDGIDITFTAGQRNMKWDSILEMVRDTGDYFWAGEDEDGNKMPLGWNFLNAESDRDTDDEDDAGSNFSEDIEEEEDEEESEDWSDMVEDEDEESSGWEDEDDEEDEGWEELEEKARKSDAKRKWNDDGGNSSKKRRR